jgi:hypothetical protein
VEDKVFDSVDWVTAMNYDVSAQDHSSYASAVQCYDYWQSRGLPLSQLVVGMPFFSQPSQEPFSELVGKGCNSNNDQFGGETFNGRGTCAAKTQLAFDRKAGGIMMWQLTQDASGADSLLSAIDTVVQDRDSITEPVAAQAKPNQDASMMMIAFIGGLVAVVLMLSAVIFAVYRHRMKRNSQPAVVNEKGFAAAEEAIKTKDDAVAPKPTHGGVPIMPKIPHYQQKQNSSQTTQSVIGAPAPAKPTLLPQSKLGQVRTLTAKYAYTAADSTELTFQVGDKLVILEDTTSAGDGWFLAHQAGTPASRGLVPANHLG